MKASQNLSRKTGNVIFILCVLFLLFDAIMKIIKFPAYVEGTKELGFPENAVPVIGIILLVFTFLYLVPRTAILGLLLLSAYLGGAAAITFRASGENHPYLFPIFFAILLWTGECLRNERIRSIFGLAKRPG